MKSARKKILVVALTVLMYSFSSCDLFELDINQDPNSPSKASVGLLLTNVELNASATFADDLNESTMGFMAITTSSDDFNMTNNTWSTYWDYLYSNPLKDLDGILKATAQQRLDGAANPHYEGIAKVLKAYYFSLMVDLWGDVPYSEAFNGDATDPSLTPAFDDDAAIYANLIVLLDEAIAHFAETTPVPVTGDVIYGGNAARWAAAAKSLKLKLLLQMSKADPSVVTALNATVTAGGFITASANDFQFTFGTLTNPDDRHPGYQDAYAGGEAGYTYFGHQYMFEMLDKNDPRRPFYFKRQTATILTPDDPTQKQTIPCSQRTDCKYGYFPLSNYVASTAYGLTLAELAVPANLRNPSAAGTYTLDEWIVDNGEVANEGQVIAVVSIGGVPSNVVAPYTGTLAHAKAEGSTSNQNVVIGTVDALSFLAGIFGRDRSDPSGIPNDNPLRTTVGVYPNAGLYDDVPEPGGGNKGRGSGIFPMITTWMVKLWQAEAALTVGSPGNARTLFNDAMTDQINKVSVFGVAMDPDAIAISAADRDAYIAARLAEYDAAADNQARLRTVLKEAWFMNFGNGFEVYNTFRRTGYPNDLQTPLQRPRQFALRLPYGLNEVNLNPNTPVVVYDSPSSAVFWDVLKFQFN